MRWCAGDTFAVHSCLGWFMHNSHVSQYRKHFDVRMVTKPHTLLEHVCEECPLVVISTFQGAATFSSHQRRA